MTLQDCMRFIAWVKHRLLNKHQYNINDPIINNIEKVLYYLSNINNHLSDNEWDKIIEKYYADYNMDYSADLGLGFDETHRIKLKNDIKNLVSDVIHKRIPKDFLLKG